MTPSRGFLGDGCHGDASAVIYSFEYRKQRMRVELSMESDEAVNENLRLQFRALQEQQQKRLQRMMERKKEKEREKERERSKRDENPDERDDESNPFTNAGDPPPDINRRLLEDENEQLQHQLREVKDENGRLHKLLKEKEFEIKHLRRKIEDNKLAFAGTATVAGDVAATKIVELSKRNRELTAEMESERTRAKQLSSKMKEMEKELQNAIAKLQIPSGKDSINGQTATRTAEPNPVENPETKSLQEKLAAANVKMTDYRNQIQTLKQELKMAHKVLANEVGEEVNISQLVGSSGGWRGRAQQILALQGRVRELEGQLGQGRSPVSELSVEEEMWGISVPKKLAAQEKNVFRIRALEKEKREALEKLTREHEAVKKENEELKKKSEASKARNKVLSSEAKTLKAQMTTLIEKGKHDDELIDALLSQQKSMQEVLSRLSQQERQGKDSQQTLNMHLNSETQKQNALVTQLKHMVAEREAKLKQLEEEVKRLTNNPKTPQSSESHKPAEDLEPERLGPVRPSSDGGDISARQGSSRSVSGVGHELVESAAPLPTSGNSRVSPPSPDVRGLQTQNTEFRALCKAAEVERDRLLELVSVLQRRIEETSDKALQAEKKLQEERRRSVLLEQQLEKLKIDASRNGAAQKLSARGKAGQSLTNSRHFGERTDLSLVRPSDLPLETQIEELSTTLAIQMDENESLKTALKSTLKTKEDDLRLYQDMIGEVKAIFLQALRQHKQQKSAA